jgi:hypothetical protein
MRISKKGVESGLNVGARRAPLQPVAVLPFLVAEQLAETPFAVTRLSSGLTEKGKHGIDPPLLPRYGIKYSSAL